MSSFSTNREQLHVMNSTEIAIWLSRFVLACVNNAGGCKYAISPTFVEDAVNWLDSPYDPKDWEDIVALRNARTKQPIEEVVYEPSDESQGV